MLVLSRLRLTFVALACVLAASSVPASEASAAAPGADPSGTVWLCQPRAAGDPCAAPLTTTVVSASGARTVDDIADATDPPADCFFVYPTVSTEPGRNSDLVIQPAEIGVAVVEASQFSQVCRVWAPMYRQQTSGDLAGANGAIHIDRAAENVAYASVLSAWKDYLAHDNDGRPVVFIGHSQGAAMLIRLLAAQIDSNAALRSRMISAIILGGNVQVPRGARVGGSFAHISTCASAKQTACVIAYSSFTKKPPADTLFGQPGQGVSLQSNQTRRTGMQVACTNPAALGGGSAILRDSFYGRGMTVLGQRIRTPWVSYPDLYRAQCKSAGGATWLQVTAATGDPRPIVTPKQGPRWGLHADDDSLAVGNLVADVASEEAAFAG